MTKINYSLSTRANPDGKKEIYLRFIGRCSEIYRGKTNLYINPSYWNDEIGMPITKHRSASISSVCKHFEAKLINLSTALTDAYNGSKNRSKQWMKELLEGMQWDGDVPIVTASTKLALLPINVAYKMMIDEKLEEHLIGSRTARCYSLIRKKLDTMCEDTPMRVCDLTDEGIEKVIRYFRTENCRGWEKSDNYITHMTKDFGILLTWLRKKDKSIELGTLPKVKPLVYGTPFYLDKSMRDTLAAAPMPNKRLRDGRDIFILQCYIGCRYSDLQSFTYANISDGVLSYIAQKTITHEPKTITIPLHPNATAIIDKFRGKNGDHIIPKVSMTALNNRLKKVFAACPDVDKPVVVRDKHTGKSATTTMSKVASTHMARRTFIGCLYENGFRESDICALSGHAEGSISIQRYRRVSDAIKQSMIDSL